MRRFAALLIGAGILMLPAHVDPRADVTNQVRAR